MREVIEDVVEERPAYDYRWLTCELRCRGIVANHKRIAKIMLDEALTPDYVKRFVMTTDSKHALPAFPNRARDFTPTEPDQLWVADIT